MGTRMLQRRGTAAEWASANPVLGDGELGWERDTGVVKVGDGATAWASLTSVYRRFIDSVAKVGDTMTGNLTISKADPKLLLQETVTDRLQLRADTGMQYVEVDDELSVTAIDTPGTLKNLRAANVYDNGNRVYSSVNPPPAAANPFAVIDALGDILVGSGPDAVARLPKGANGTVLTIDGSGNVVWAAAASASDRVLKAGDTMTGKLTITSDSVGSAWEGGTLEIRDNNRPRIGFHQPGAVACSFGQEDNLERLRTFSNNGTDYAPLRADLYDIDGTRIRASELGGMKVLGGNGYNGATNIPGSGWTTAFSFVAPSSGKAIITAGIGPGNQMEFSLDGTNVLNKAMYMGSDSGLSKVYMSGLTPGGTYYIYLRGGGGGTAYPYSVFVEG